MNSAYRKLQSSLPITPDRVFKLDDQEVEHIDQYIFRFSKLQDAIGNKLFKSVLAELGEEVPTNQQSTFLIESNRLELLKITRYGKNFVT